VHVTPDILRRMSKGLTAQFGAVQIRATIHFAAYRRAPSSRFPESHTRAAAYMHGGRYNGLSVTETGDRKVDADTEMDWRFQGNGSSVGLVCRCRTSGKPNYQFGHFACTCGDGRMIVVIPAEGTWPCRRHHHWYMTDDGRLKGGLMRLRISLHPG